MDKQTLREKFFKECTDILSDSSVKINIAPNDLFEWFMKELQPCCLSNDSQIEQMANEKFKGSLSTNGEDKKLWIEMIKEFLSNLSQNTETGLLSEQLKHEQNIIKEAHAYLSSIGISTNGEEGTGKRQTLTLVQRIKSLSPQKEDWSRLSRITTPEKWIEMYKDYQELLTKEDVSEWLSEQYNIANKERNELKALQKESEWVSVEKIKSLQRYDVYGGNYIKFEDIEKLLSTPPNQK